MRQDNRGRKPYTPTRSRISRHSAVKARAAGWDGRVAATGARVRPIFSTTEAEGMAVVRKALAN